MKLETTTSAWPASVPAPDAVDPLGPHLSALAPVAVTLQFTEVTLDDYDRLLSSLSLTRHGTGLPGCLFHWVHGTTDGWTVDEVWQNQTLFGVYRRDEIEPALRRLHLPEPQVSVVPVYNYLESAALVHCR